MAIFKCKMCGGTLEVNNSTVATCEYCGAQQTLPKMDDERLASLYDRGNHFRRAGDFDKALAIYENIVQENAGDAEAHWCCVLCRFGIEYVEDPATFEWVPTCHRASFDSIMEDVDYLAAVEHSDGITRRQYQKEAAKIAAVQRGILATSQKEEPFDVFICYKDSDDQGNRTKDSTLAQDIYYQLTEQGRRVFFARITLEDKVGTEYEPYIFAALNSAKVMVVVGTKPEYLNAVWVKNEWSRFLALMKKDRSKLLLPCYRDMDPYDLPEQLSVLQSYDMSKIGFIQDLTRGIAKVMDAEAKPTVKETVVVQQSGGPNTDALLERGMMALEDGEWAKADGFFEEVLNQNPKCAQAYLGKLMGELRVRYQDDLKNCSHPFDERNNFQKALRFADDNFKKELQGYIDFIVNRNFTVLYDDAFSAMKLADDFHHTEDSYERAAEKFEKISDFKDAKELAAKCRENAREAKLSALYKRAKDMMDSAITDNGYQFAAGMFEDIADYKDSAALARECYEKAEEARKDEILIQAKAKTAGNAAGIGNYESAIKLLKSIPGWRNADELIGDYQNKIEEIEAQQEAARLEANRRAEIAKKRRKTTSLIVAAAVVVAVAAALLYTKVIVPNSKYNDAVALMDAGKYREAMAAFRDLGGYKDSAYQIDECLYRTTVALMEAGEYDVAITAFEALNGYKDSATKIDECNAAITEIKYNDAVALMDAGKYEQAAFEFGTLGNYKDAREWWIAMSRDTISSSFQHTVGLKSDGTVVAVGRNDYSQCNVSDWADIVTIAAGGYHTVGLKSDGTVIAVGSNSNGQCDIGGWSDIISLAAGAINTAGLKSDGTVIAVGYNGDGRCNVSDWHDIVALVSGFSYIMGLKSDGTVVAVGDNEHGQCNIRSWKDIITVTGGNAHTIGLKSDGTVVAAGKNDYGQCNVRSWKDIVAVAAGHYHTVGLKSDGTVVAVGSNSSGQCNVRGWTDIIAVYAGEGYTVGLKSDGTVVAVGHNYHGQCDVSSWTNIKTP